MNVKQKSAIIRQCGGEESRLGRITIKKRKKLGNEKIKITKRRVGERNPKTTEGEEDRSKACLRVTRELCLPNG